MKEIIYISQVLLLIFIAAAAWMDLKENKIPVIFAAAGILAGLILSLFSGQLYIYEILGGCLIGAVLMVVSKFSKQAIGLGDGIMLAATGAFLGFTGNVVLLFSSLVISGIVSVVLLLAKKIKKKDRIPFIPFILCGYIGVLLCFPMESMS